MNAIEIHRIKDFHYRKIKEWGMHSPRALGYADDVSQRARFQVIADLFDFNGKSVLDVGCGDGGLKHCLNKRYTNFTYTGIDQQDDFILYARHQYKNDANCTFIIGDFTTIELPNADVVIASGALSYRCEDSEYYIRCIKKFFDSARRALIFNMLDQSKMFPDEMMVGHDFEKIKSVCQTLTPDIFVVTNYLYFDFTILLLKAV